MNKQYLKYLFKQRKVAYLFFGLLFAAIALSGFISRFGMNAHEAMLNESIYIAMGCAILFTYLMPVILMSFVHRRRSADLYFALPLSRRELLVTTMAFIIGLVWLYYTVSISIAFIAAHVLNLLYWGKVVLLAGFIITVMTLFHTALFLIANNIFDGIVMIGAYSVLPLLIYIVTSSFIENTVAGFHGYEIGETISLWFSPLVLSVELMIQTVRTYISADAVVDLRYAAALAVYGVASAVVLKKEFIERMTERAEQVSDRLFSYPLIINLYAFCLMISMASGRTSLRGNLIWYLILLMIYIIAMFVYRRKVQVQWKDLVLYAAGVLLSFALSAAAWHTRGFGLADRYRLDASDTIVYNYNINVDRNDLGRARDFYGEGSTVSLSLMAEIRLDEKEKYAEVLEILEDKRREAIDDYYNWNYNGPAGHLNIYNETTYKDGQHGYVSTSSTNYFNYVIRKPLSEEELKILTPYCLITVYDVEETYGEEGLYELTLEEFLERRGK